MSDKQDGPPACATLAEVGEQVGLSDAARDLLKSFQKVPDYLEHLVSARKYIEVLRVRAFTMPIRKAVWWCCLSSWHGTDRAPEPLEDPALRAAVHWVVEPTAANREEAARMGASGNFKLASTCCAQAAGLAGNITAADKSFVPGQLLLAAQVLSHGVNLAVNQRARKDTMANCRLFYDLGQQAAEGKIPWSAASPV